MCTNTLPLHEKKKYMQVLVKVSNTSLTKDTLEINSIGSLLEEKLSTRNRDGKEAFHWILVEHFEF